VTFDEMEQALRTRLEALPPAARAELRHVLSLPRLRLRRRDRHFLGTAGDPELRGVADRPGRGQGGTGGRVRTAEGDGAEVASG
jgi:hypothetical protein